MVAVTESPPGHEELRQMALDHLWMNSRSWTEMAELGEPNFLVEGDGVRVRDVAEVGETGAGDEADVARPHYADASQRSPFRLIFMDRSYLAGRRPRGAPRNRWGRVADDKHLFVKE